MISTLKLGISCTKGELANIHKRRILILFEGFVVKSCLSFHLDERNPLKVGTNCYYCLHWLLRHPEYTFTVKQEEKPSRSRGNTLYPFQFVLSCVLPGALSAIVFYPAATENTFHLL